MYHDYGGKAPLTIRELETAILLTKNGRMAVLTFYGDDSGNHGKGVFIAAGYLATSGNWKAVEKEWRAIRLAAPKIEYFKMNECHRLKKQFDGRSRTSADKKLFRLVDLLCRHLSKGKLWEFSSVIPWEVWDRVVTGKLRVAHPHPYYFCFHGVASLMVKELRRRGKTEPIHFVFDHQSNLDNLVHEQFMLAKAMPETGNLMHGLTFGDDKEDEALQASDLLAWQINRAEVTGSQRRELELLRSSALVSKSAIWTEQRLAEFCSRHK